MAIVVQWLEHRLVMPEVAGSSPVGRPIPLIMCQIRPRGNILGCLALSGVTKRVRNIITHYRNYIP